jgi:hypothetical protein
MKRDLNKTLDLLLTEDPPVAPARSGRRPLAVVTVGLAITLGGIAQAHHTRATFTPTCTQSFGDLHSGVTDMITFCPKDPALAQDVNHNFERYLDYLADHFGPAGVSDLTMSSLTVYNAKLYLGPSSLEAFNSGGDSLYINQNGQWAGGVTIDSKVSTGSTVTITGTLTVPSSFVTGTGTATTPGRSDHYHDPTCPSNTGSDGSWSVTKNNSRMCIYLWGSGASPTWYTAATQCFSLFEAELCSVSELRLGTGSGSITSVTTNRWLSDRAGNVEAAYTNSTSTTNFDAVAAPTTGLSGAYCCRYLRRP